MLSDDQRDDQDRDHDDGPTYDRRANAEDAGQTELRRLGLALTLTASRGLWLSRPPEAAGGRGNPDARVRPPERPRPPPISVVPHLASRGPVPSVSHRRGQAGMSATAGRRASHAASASPMGVDGGPSTNGQISSAMARQLAVAVMSPSRPNRPRLIRCRIT